MLLEQHPDTSSEWLHARARLLITRAFSEFEMHGLERGKPVGGSRPAWARLPRQGFTSVSRRVRSPERQVRPSLRKKTLASERPPSL